MNAIQRVVALNGIDAGTLRGDLGDRLVPIELRRIPDDQRRVDRELQEDWKRLHPGLLGALLDLLADVLAELPGMQLDSMPRMADFARVLAAVDAVRGTSSLAIYLESRNAVSQEVVEGDPVAAAVRLFVQKRAARDLDGGPSGRAPPPSCCRRCPSQTDPEKTGRARPRGWRRR